MTLIAWTMSLSGGVVAAPTDPAAAEDAFQQGRNLLAEQRFNEACGRFEESQRLDPASGTLLALAYCQERAGLLASASANYRAAAELSEREGRLDRRDAAASRIAELSGRVSRLTILVPSTLAARPELRVTRNGLAIEPGMFGTPIPVDGGKYQIAAALGDKTCWSSTIVVAGEKDQKTLTIEVTLPAPVAANGPTRANPDATPRRDRGSDALARAGLAAGLGSLVSFAVGSGFALVAHAKNRASDRDGHCDASGCDPAGFDLRHDALAAARVSTWSFVVGGVFAFAGVGLYLGSKLGQTQPSTRLEASAGPESGRLQLRTVF